MINGVLIIHILITAALIGLVLIQKSEGGALGMGGGSSGGGFMTTRGTANLLTRVTGVLAALFFVTTLSLAWLAKGEGRPKSILEGGPSQVTAPVVLPTPGTVAPGAPLEKLDKTVPSSKVDAPVPQKESKPAAAAAGSRKKS